MIFYFNEQGEQLGLFAERVFQGSTKTNGVVMVCPATQANVVTARFALADHQSTCEVVLMRDQSFDTCKLQDENGVKYSAWVCDIPAYVTKTAGIVKVQFFITSVGGVKRSTATTSFMVEEGVTSSEPEKFDTYGDVVNALNRITGELETLKSNGGGSLYEHTISGYFYDNYAGENIAFENVVILDTKQDEITTNNLTTRLCGAVSIIDGGLTGNKSGYQNSYSPLKYCSNFGVPVLMCIDHNNIELRLMIMTSGTVSSWSVEKSA